MVGRQVLVREQAAQPGAKTIRDVMERTDGFDLDLVAARSD